MIYFITFLKALATCIITNAHYTGIYPTDIIANGGLIGDVLFFSISGYCLYNIKMNFFQWYLKRFYRIYLPVTIVTVLFIILGFYKYSDSAFFYLFVYPTKNHFVASIMVLYIPFYFFIKNGFIKNNLIYAMIFVCLIFIIVYIGFYDKSYYHIDKVRQPMVRFIYFESMLLGAYFRQNDSKFRNVFKWYYPVGGIVFFLIYSVSKMMFVSRQSISEYQILNQFAIFVLLVFIFLTFAGLDSRLEALPLCFKKIIGFLAPLTLEIYILQKPIIDHLRFIKHFPLNWLCITVTIFLSAYILHWLCEKIYRMTDNIKAKKTENK